MRTCVEPGVRQHKEYYMQRTIKHFWKDDSGATALEYGVMAGLIAGVIIAAVTLIGTNLNGVFGAINTALAAVPGA
jgi:pilus assembly protein Flp/PilA